MALIGTDCAGAGGGSRASDKPEDSESEDAELEREVVANFWLAAKAGLDVQALHLTVELPIVWRYFLPWHYL
jgi:hypothetical protein